MENIKTSIVIVSIEQSNVGLLKLEQTSLTQEQKEAIKDTVERCCKHSNTTKDCMNIYIERFSNKGSIDCTILYSISLSISTLYSNEKIMEISDENIINSRPNLLNLFMNNLKKSPMKEVIAN